MNTFITLTYSYDVDYSESKKYLRKFFRKLNYDYKGLKYIWILELQKRGRINYHILTNANFGISYLSKGKRKTEKHKRIEREVAARYWKQGFIDIRHLGAEANTNIALYVASYIVKDLLEIEELRGQKVYSYSYKTMD